MENSKSARYFKYAIGEIILVVIGILIALQINNWNEKSKTLNSVKEQLHILDQNISDNLSQLKVLNQSIQNKINSGEQLSEQFQEIKPFDSLTTSYIVELLFEQNFYKNRGAYDKLVISGEYAVLPTDLQNQITEYYTLLDRVKEREEITNTFIKKEIEPHYFNAYSQYTRKGNLNPIVKAYYEKDKRPPIPLNVQDLKNDSKMEAISFGSLYQSKTQHEFYEKAIEKAEHVKTMIQDYLNDKV